MEDDLQWKMTFAGPLHAAYSALRHFLIFYRLYICFQAVLLFLEYLFSPYGTQLGYKEPPWTYMGPKRDPQIGSFWATDSTKYRGL